MAIPALAPSFARSKKIVTETRARASLQLVPNYANGETADRRVFVVFLSIIGGLGLLFLLVINTFLAQDAFQLHKLQAQVMTLNDQRDAVLKKIATASSPEVLSAQALKAGMIPSQSPRFLSISPSSTTIRGARQNG